MANRLKASAALDTIRRGKTSIWFMGAASLLAIVTLLFAALYFAGVLPDLRLAFYSALALAPLIALFGFRVIYDYTPSLCKMVWGFIKGHPTILQHGIWEGRKVRYAHFFDRKLCDELARFFSEENAASVADFGCGTGAYVRALHKALQIECHGFDGNPDTEALSQGAGRVQNIAVPFHLGRRYDWVLSLEVGEHLPKEFEQTFIDNLIAHAEKGIVLSWGKKGQGGHGHVNEQNGDYIKAIFAHKGWKNDAAAEKRLGEASYPVYFWFYDTIMVFRKDFQT